MPATIAQISGASGSGKTTLCQRLASKRKCVLFEPVERGPELPWLEGSKNFLVDLQCEIITLRSEALRRAIQGGEKLIFLDRWIDEDICVFGKMFTDLNLLDLESLARISDHAKHCVNDLPEPTITFYLAENIETLTNRLNDRGESELIASSILQQVDLYNQWMHHSRKTRPLHVLFNSSEEERVDKILELTNAK